MIPLCRISIINFSVHPLLQSILNKKAAVFISVCTIYEFDRTSNVRVIDLLSGMTLRAAESSTLIDSMKPDFKQCWALIEK